MKFKKGDKVRCIGGDYNTEIGLSDYPKIGMVYTVSEYQDDEYPVFEELTGAALFWDDKNFVLVASKDLINAELYKPRRYPYYGTGKDTVLGMPKEDIVNNPAHYTQGKIQCIDFIDDQKLGFYEAQILKYTVRAKHKGNELQDLKKAQFYLNRKIKLLEESK